MIIVDTNVVSELMKSEPSPKFQGWVRERDVRELKMTAITVAEILHGIERLPNGKRKSAIRRDPQDVFGRFAADILAFDVAAASLYAEIVDHRGAPISGYDAQIAGICLAHGAPSRNPEHQGLREHRRACTQPLGRLSQSVPDARRTRLRSNGEAEWKELPAGLARK
ncbi:MAG: hypothetical protein NVSMB4_02500 [Acidimicrobiales bacterium]